MKRYLLLLAFGSLLTACTGDKFVAGPEVTPGPSYKFKTSQRGGEVINPNTKWWANYGDPTLNRLVEESLAQNISVEQARERINSARFQAKIARASYLPAIGASGSYTRERTKTEGIPTQNTTNSAAALSGSWLLDFFGAKKTAESQNAIIEQQKEALNDARLTVISNITLAYLNAQGLGRQIEIARKSLAVQNDTARITEAKVEAGTASSLDSTRARGAAALTASDIPTLTQAREQAINSVAILLGKEPAEIDSAFSKQRGIKRPRANFSEGIPVDLLRNRPDIREAEWALRQAVADIGVAEADLLPQLTLNGSISASHQSGIGIYPWGFGPSLTLPIFQGGALKANVDLSKSTARVQYLAYRQTVLDAIQDVEDAMVALREEQKRAAQLSVAVDQYSKAEVLARQLNDAGTTEFSDVLDAQSSLYSAQLQYAQSSQLVATNYATLCASLGGGWDGYEPVRDEPKKVAQTN